MRVPRPIRPREIQISRCVEKLILDVKAGGLFLGAFYFALSDLPGYTEFNLFDQYKIRSIDLKFCPTFTNNIPKGVLGADSLNLPLLSTSIDRDDATAPASLATILENQTCINHGTFNHVVNRHIASPQISLSAYQGAFTGYAQTTSWLDTSTSGIEHYGCKYALESCPVLTSSCYLVVYATYHLSFRYPI
jgi:hypothetical protein